MLGDDGFAMRRESRVVGQMCGGFDGDRIPPSRSSHFEETVRFKNIYFTSSVGGREKRDRDA